jgi:formylglycine-generating enzyme
VNPRTPYSLPPVMPFRWACAYGEDRTGLWQAFEVAGVRQVMRWIPPGEFLMGSPTAEKERGNSERQHRVVLTEGFWLADTACTQALWVAVMGENPSHFKDSPQNPVEHVSWNDIADAFLPKLNALAPGLDLVLPTEEQWEYACRAGTTTPFSWGEQITPAQVNHVGGKSQTVPVKALPANEWGIHQMHGNVWEWCVDETAHLRIARGGCWSLGSQYCRASSRTSFHADSRDDIIGFRLAVGAG